MDLWDIAKLMWRRWYVTLPLVLLTATGAMWTLANVTPDYQVTGHFAIVGSSSPRPEVEERVNPWSTESLAEAATIRLGGKALADQLAAEGYEGEWSLGVSGRQPWLMLEVVASTPEQAQATVERLREVVEEEVRTRQNDYNVPPEDQITAVWFDEGETVETVTGKLRRALIAVVGAGLVFTMGVVVAFDAAVRRWRRSRTTPVPSEDSSPRARYTFGTDIPERAGLATAAAGSGSEVTGVRVNGKSAPARNPEPATQASVPIALAAPPPEPSLDWPESPARDHGAGRSPEVPDDATIVLPISGRPWAGRPSKSGEGDPDPDRRS